MLKYKHPLSQNMTLFGNKVVVGVIKGKMRSSWVSQVAVVKNPPANARDAGDVC